MHAISIHNVTKQYRLGRMRNGKPVHVLDSVSLNVQKGEFVGIIGPNGCGKSTLFKMILGLEKPGSGEVTVLGKKPEDIQMGYVPQHSSGALYPWFTSKENLDFAVKENNAGTAQLISNKIQEFGVSMYTNAYPYQLSGGLKQLLSIARATLYSNILLLDEPLTGLDYQNRMAVEKKLLDMRNGQNTAVMISHDIESAILLCDRIIILTPKPARIKAVLAIPLPKNRTHETRFLPEYQHALSNVYAALLE
ncbi:MAG: ABC transporter ATP-binding protein [Candidatus Diapherotrites archaeon]|nr:ABC transporter ATP-binding protein [Candidatus Diapherotrites archaeon]